MPAHRSASACMPLLLGVLLLLVVMRCTTGATPVAAEDDTTVTSYLDYFLGDLFQDRGSMNRDKEPKAPPRFRPWRIIDVPDDSVLAFDCTGDVPTLHVVPRSDDCVIVDDTNRTPPPMDDTCGGGAQAAGTRPTPMQYKFTRSGRNKTAGYSALFWGPPSSGGEEGGEGELMPVPKFQLKAILKAVAVMMESSWRKEKGDDEAVPDMVVFYFNNWGWLVAMGREDVEFHQPWETQRLNGEIKFKALHLGTVV